MIEETIRAFREERIKDTEYLKQITSIMDAVVNRTGDKIPTKLKEHDVAKAFFGIIKENFPPISEEPDKSDDALADIAIAVDEIIERNRIVNWAHNIDIQNKMRTEIEDFIFDLKEQLSLEIDFEIIDNIMDQCIAIAVTRKPWREDNS